MKNASMCWADNTLLLIQECWIAACIFDYLASKALYCMEIRQNYSSFWRREKRDSSPCSSYSVSVCFCVRGHKFALKNPKTWPAFTKLKAQQFCTKISQNALSDQKLWLTWLPNCELNFFLVIKSSGLVAPLTTIFLWETEEIEGMFLHLVTFFLC